MYIKLKLCVHIGISIHHLCMLTVFDKSYEICTNPYRNSQISRHSNAPPWRAGHGSPSFVCHTCSNHLPHSYHYAMIPTMATGQMPRHRLWQGFSSHKYLLHSMGSSTVFYKHSLGNDKNTVALFVCLLGV